MNNFGTPTQGMYSGGNIRHFENAIIDEISTVNGMTGYILVSYRIPDVSGIYFEQIRLDVGRNTRINLQFGRPLYLYQLEAGMLINAEALPTNESTVPPRFNAIRITVLSSEQPAAVNVTIDRVVSNDTVNGMLTTGNPFDINDQMVFNISDATIIQDRNSRQVPLGAVKPGMMVRVEHANFQTASIPPQSPAYRVQILS